MVVTAAGRQCIVAISRNDHIVCACFDILLGIDTLPICGNNRICTFISSQNNTKGGKLIGLERHSGDTRFGTAVIFAGYGRCLVSITLFIHFPIRIRFRTCNSGIREQIGNKVSDGVDYGIEETGILYFLLCRFFRGQHKCLAACGILYILFVKNGRNEINGHIDCSGMRQRIIHTVNTKPQIIEGKRTCILVAARQLVIYGAFHGYKLIRCVFLSNRHNEEFGMIRQHFHTGDSGGNTQAQIPIGQCIGNAVDAMTVRFLSANRAIRSIIAPVAVDMHCLSANIMAANGTMLMGQSTANQCACFIITSRAMDMGDHTAGIAFARCVMFVSVLFTYHCTLCIIAALAVGMGICSANIFENGTGFVMGMLG